MEKDQPDSLATVAVVSEKMPQTHSHYAPSEVYSTTEPPPAYMRPPTKSTAVQIARIAAITLITMSVVLGSFILAASWVQARASCTPESIATMQAELKRQQQQTYGSYQPQGEFLKHLQPEALVQEPVESKDSLQSLAAPTKKEVDPDTKDMKAQGEGENSKSDNENGDRDDDDDDYDDDEFPPVHIKLPLQLDLDDIAGTLIQQARSRVSCVVERRRADEVMDGTGDNGLDNSTDPQRFQRLSGERVAILCESGGPNQEQQEQEMLTPIIVPLGTVQIPLQSQEPNPGYHQYQIHTQYQVPDMQQLPLSDPRGLNHIPPGVLPPELRNLPQLTMEMRPPRMGPQTPMMGPQSNPMGPQIEMRQIPIELRHFPMDPMRGMRPMPQDPRQEPQQVSMVYQQQAEQIPNSYNQEQGPAMMPPPPPQPEAQEQDPRIQQIPPMMIPQTEQRPPAPPQVTPEKPRSPFQGIPIEIRRIIQQVPLEIKNIIQHITGEARAIPVQVPEGARREELKSFPEGARPIPLGPFPLPVEVRNLIEHGNIEGRQRPDNGEEQQEAKAFSSPEDDSDEERNFPIPMEIRNIIHQVVEGRAFQVPRFALRPVKSMEVPVEAHAEVTDGQSTEQQQPEHREQEQHQASHMMSIQHQQEQQQQQQQQQQPMQEEESRPHYVQPRSVRSVPDEVFLHRREKRVRRCACDCAC
ncbi:PREDICTED: putative mediator of RNA polymerase II transcription subunit 26 [Wasmannia auropunctata]|uniref:putative mediator of RNA polymerase II transcription subunit 26 n=1 Tax=Wasmannia auropunctata TaxID=64793 RepID=UPI0005EF5966|nr:PREDICTED: putative mediator of RNA polymerase II transcription subunit 26 [Wasmannia auropunctata]